MTKQLTFNIGDVIRDYKDNLLTVTGVVHDAEDLYVTDYSGLQLNNGKEFKIKFFDVQSRFVCVWDV